MTICDKERYNTADPSVDMLGLGENPALKVLNKVLVRSQLSFMDKDSLLDRGEPMRV